MKVALVSGVQWEVTKAVVRSLLPERYDFAVQRLGEIADWGWGAIYTWIPHLAEKEWVDLEDFVDVFKRAWPALGARAPGTLDQEILDRSIRQAETTRRQLGI